MSIENTLKTFAIVSIATILLTSFPLEKDAEASSISTSLQEYTLQPGDIEFGTLEFTSSEKEDLKIKLDVKSYDPEKEVFLDTTPFIAVKQSSYTVKPGQEISIDYALSIPLQQPTGTYFNVITIEPELGNDINGKGGSISLKNGFGSLFAFHIEDGENTIDKIFIEKSDTTLIIEKRGFPLISPMTVKYIYKNNSNFVFKPQGEIRIVDKEGNQILERVQINPQNKTIYPGGEIEIQESFKTWDDLEKALDTKIITARIYNGFTDNYLTNQVEVSIKEPIGVVAVLASMMILGTIAGVARLISYKMGSRKKVKVEPAQ